VGARQDFRPGVVHGLEIAVDQAVGKPFVAQLGTDAQRAEALVGAFGDIVRGQPRFVECAFVDQAVERAGDGVWIETACTELAGQFQTRMLARDQQTQSYTRGLVNGCGRVSLV
jgi:hypothetical protein